jgi:outer membrane protein W
MRKLFSVFALLVLVASIPALAAQGDMILRFGTAYVSPTGDYSESYEEGSYTGWYKEEADAALGGFVGFEYMFTDLFGLDATLLYSNHDADYSWVDMIDGEVDDSESGTYGDISFMPFFVGANFHVVQNDAIDFYVGPFVAYVMYGDVDSVDGPEFDACIKNDLGYGVVAGLDVPFGSGGWMFSTAIRYMKTGAESDEDPEFFDNYTVDVDPVILQVGVGVKW